jgi:ribosomal protein S18 acetylase RimI-like enzyme
VIRSGYLIGVEGSMSGGNGEPPSEVMVRPATPEDAARVADLHMTAINEGFLASLGPRFLGKLYARIVKSPHGFLIVAFDPGPGPVIGFVAGATSVRRLYGEFLLRDGLIAGVSSAPRLVRSIPRVVETLRYGAKDESSPSSKERGESSEGSETELLSLAVAASARGRGAGAKLVRSFHAAAAQAGSRTARVVVAAANETAIRVYLETGFVEAERFELHAGTESLLLRADLSSICPP